MPSSDKSYLYANRNEIDITLSIKEGTLPENIYGVVYITSMCGSLNSEGLPIPEKYPGETEHNPEYGAPVMAGDGMILKIDFNTTGKVQLKTLITKPPCYYADLATSRMNPGLEEKFRHYGFKTAGLARASVPLGFRNELNTALIPFRFSEDQYPRILITHDTGRPWEFNPETLELITPLGAYQEWMKSTPAALKFPFYPVQTSAHPSFDPVAQELYTVNYTQQKPFSYAIAFLLLLLEHRDEVKQHLEEFGGFFQKFETLLHEDKIKTGLQKVLKLFFDKLHHHEHFKPKIKEALRKYRIEAKTLETGNRFVTPDAVYLLQWKGEPRPLKRWKVLDEKGNDLVIEECMHQTAITEEYILLADSSFKFAPDLLFTNPFPEVPVIDRMLRRLLNERSPLDMALYIIKRSDLKEDSGSVKAKRISLPADCIHFTADYKNPNGQLTLYALNNNSVCVAEWIRPYDTLKIDHKPVYKELVGLPTIAAMDLNSISRYRIHPEMGITAQLDCQDKGGKGPGKITRGHTWEIALMSYRDMNSADQTVDHIKNLYVFSAGLSSERLTDFMYDLYKDIPERKVPLKEVMEHTELGVPACLFRMDTEDMKIRDSYVLEFNTEIRSIQFIPAKEEREGIEYSMNGYILCTMMVGKNKTPNVATTMPYERELWLFDATGLSQGPICKLMHPELSYSFTLHSTWLPEAKEQETSYHINIREDFGNPESFLPEVQENIKEFFDKYIYPYFEGTVNREQGTETGNKVFN